MTSPSNRRFHRAGLAGGLLLAGLLCLIPPAAAAAGALSQDLAALQLVAGGDGQVEVIVSYRGPVGRREVQRIHRLGASNLTHLWLIDALAARLPAASLSALAADPGVISVAWNEMVRAATDVAVPALGGTMARDVFGVHGEGVRIAVVDSGVEPVAGLGSSDRAPLGRIAAWVDLVDPENSSPSDPFGHGTHVAGVMAGAEVSAFVSGRRTRYAGVAPGAEIISVRVLDEAGRGRASVVIEGIQWVVEHAQELEIRILNLSLGHPVRESAMSDPLVKAVERAWDAGIFVVASAGNHGRDGGPGGVTSPGNSPSVLTVGALADRDTGRRSDDIVATYSSRGPTRFDGIVKPDLLAPGDSVVSLRAPGSALDRLAPGNRIRSTSRLARAGRRGSRFGQPAHAEWFRMSGTSVAAAATSGAAAILLSVDPDLAPATLKARLMRSAEKRDENIYTRGAGALDLMAALDETGFAPVSRSPRVSADDPVAGPEAVVSWSRDGSWDAAEIYGPVALWNAGWAREQRSAWSPEPTPKGEVAWEVPNPRDRRERLLWVRIEGPQNADIIWHPRGAEGVMWQGKRSGSAEGVMWQDRRKVEAQTEGVMWQDKHEADADAEGVMWKDKRKADADAEGVMWQDKRKADADAEGVMWQDKRKADADAEGVMWQDKRKADADAEGVMWQDKRKADADAEGVMWQGKRSASTEGVMWQATDGHTKILLEGDRRVRP